MEKPIASKKPRFKLTRRQQDAIQGYGFLLPAAVIVAIFFLAAIVFALYMSVNKVNMYSQQYEFRGLQNYANIFSDGIALTALKNTALFSLVVVPIQTVFALVIAYALSSKTVRFKKKCFG
nr:hypothetical protein [Lacticaseibacillus camelliae]